MLATIVLLPCLVMTDPFIKMTPTWMVRLGLARSKVADIVSLMASEVA